MRFLLASLMVVALATTARAGDELDTLVKTETLTDVAVGEGGELSREARALLAILKGARPADELRALTERAGVVEQATAVAQQLLASR